MENSIHSKIKLNLAGRQKAAQRFVEMNESFLEAEKRSLETRKEELITVREIIDFFRSESDSAIELGFYQAIETELLSSIERAEAYGIPGYEKEAENARLKLGEITVLVDRFSGSYTESR